MKYDFSKVDWETVERLWHDRSLTVTQLRLKTGLTESILRKRFGRRFQTPNVDWDEARRLWGSALNLTADQVAAKFEVQQYQLYTRFGPRNLPKIYRPKKSMVAAVEPTIVVKAPRPPRLEKTGVKFSMACMKLPGYDAEALRAVKAKPSGRL